MSTRRSQLRLLERVTNVFDLIPFLRRILDLGVATLGCSGGSVFLFDAASQRLELSIHNYSQDLSLSLAPGEGVAGKAFKKGAMLIVPRLELSEIAVRVEALRAESFRSVAAIPVPSGAPQAVFCFDFDGRTASKRGPDGLTKSERIAVEGFARDLQQREFIESLERMCAFDSLLRIRAAGEAPGRLRQGVSDFLSGLMASFRDAKKSPPDIACVQIVDWRRNTIRTVQGVGVPLSFHASVSHSLDSQDIQAEVVRTRRLHLIVGNDERYFDQDIYRKYDQERFVRLFLPLFPVPFSGLAARTALDLDEFLAQWILWQEESPRGVGALARVSNWNQDLLAEPPPTIIYGTLEVGYKKVKRDELVFAPLSPELASWVAIQAWKLGKSLFEVTLFGSLDAIGHAAATAAAEPTLLTVAMPDWRSPVARSYPLDGIWPVAVPSEQERVSPPNLQPGILTFPSPTLDADYELGNLGGLRSVVKAGAEEAVQLALRLDDYMADPYLLVSEIEDRNYVGTSVPDPKLEPLLREICREASAEACVMLEIWPGKRSSSDLGVERVWAFRVTRSSADAMKPSPQLTDQVMRAIADGMPWFGTLEQEGRHGIAILPLELADATQAALVLFHLGGALVARERKAIESRVARWVHRLSLRRLVLRDRFSTLMRRLREWVAKSRAHADGEQGRHLLAFIEFLFLRIEAPEASGAVLVLFSTSPSGPDIARRFWVSRTDAEKEPVVGNDLFVNSPSLSPSRRALREGKLIVYLPGDAQRKGDTELVNQELLKRTVEIRGRGEKEQADRLKRIVDFARGETTTMVVAPLSGQNGPLGPIEGALTVFLEGEHRFDPVQQQLMLELATLVADSIGHMRQLDQLDLEKRHSLHLERLRDLFGRAESEDEVIGYLFARMGRYPPSSASEPGWSLADDAVLWILDRENRELVVRSARGRGLEALADSLVVAPAQHPFIAELGLKFPRKRLPRMQDFPVYLFSLEEAVDPVSQAYARLSEARWLMSFALQHADGRILGVIDCLREDPLVPEEEMALKVILRRLSTQMGAALERSRHRSSIYFARRLTGEVMNHLSQLRASDAYVSVMEMLRREMNIEQCDLFLERDGRLVLHTTTRINGPRKAAEQYEYWIDAEKARDLLAMSQSGQRRLPKIRHASDETLASDGLSPALATLLAEDNHFERLVLPMQMEEGPPGSAFGLLHLRGPLSLKAQTKEATGERIVKKSGLFTREHVRRARDLAVVVQRLLAMAGLVEQQEWLVNELQHALGQPLQALRTVGDDALRALILRGATRGELALLRLRLERSSVYVQEVRNQLAVFSKMGQPQELTFLSVNLPALMHECCSFKAPEAEARGCKISPGQFSRISAVWADITWLRQAMLNLLDNAVKYSYTNREIEVELSEDDRGGIQLMVSNFGIGIPARDIPRVFNPYFRSRVPDAKGARRGSGIGLAIVRHAVECLHGGTVTVESRPTRGEKVGETADQIANIPHKTTFKVVLARQVLEQLAGREERKR